MTIKDGDIVEFLAISWNDGWDFDHPSALLKPFYEVYEDGVDPDRIIDDVTGELCYKDNISEKDFKEKFKFFKSECKWRGWKIETLERVAKNRLNGGNMWKTKIRSVLYQKVKYFSTADPEVMDCRMLEEKKA